MSLKFNYYDMEKTIGLDNFQKKYFIDREPFFQKMVPDGEIVEIKWVTPKNPTFIGFHNEYEIHFFKRGGGTYFINGIKCEVEKNSVVIIKPKQIHYFIPTKDKEIEKGTLYFLPNILKKCGLREEILDKTHPCSLLLTEEEATIIEMVLKLSLEEKEEKKKYWEEIIKALIKILILFLDRIGSKKEAKTYINPLVKEIINYIEKNFTNEITVEKIAKDLHFSISHISHIFKKNMGLSIKQYLLQRRIAEAKYILENEKYIKMAAVSERVGFSNFALFNRCFKKIVGITPFQYQKYFLDEKRDW